MSARLGFLLVLASACGPSKQGDPCSAGDSCGEGLVCLLGEDSLEGSCRLEACADGWTGYQCETGDTGAR